MPYTAITKEEVDGKTKFCFRNKETREKSCSDTYKLAVAAMRLRYHVHAGGKLTKTKK